MAYRGYEVDTEWNEPETWMKVYIDFDTIDEADQFRSFLDGDGADRFGQFLSHLAKQAIKEEV